MNWKQQIGNEIHNHRARTKRMNASTNERGRQIIQAAFDRGDYTIHSLAAKTETPPTTLRRFLTGAVTSADQIGVWLKPLGYKISINRIKRGVK